MCCGDSLYIIYKAPKLNNFGTTGLEYIYIDPKGKKTYKDHNKLIDNPNGVLANTLKPLFTTSMVRIMILHFRTLYNHRPIVVCLSVDVSGLVMMDKTTTGVWLLHSTPRFPFTRNNNFYPSSGAKNAQTFICVTFKYNEFKKIGQHLLNIAAYPFEGIIPTDFHTELQEAANKSWNNRTPGERIQDLSSAGGASFRSIAKKLYKEGDLYVAIAKTYSTDVKVQTWPCSQDGSYCENPQVINIKSVKTDLGNGEVKWTAGNDHSKWCVSTDNSKNMNLDLICIADVNRAVSQYERPGGALCFKHKEAMTVNGM
uniref:Deoxyribonuclease-2-alpha n=1 Tax=Sander lucioperca TaxID=283035 RepID=A0A8C9ZX42_SANLU